MSWLGNCNCILLRRGLRDCLRDIHSGLGSRLRDSTTRQSFGGSRTLFGYNLRLSFCSTGARNSHCICLLSYSTSWQGNRLCRLRYRYPRLRYRNRYLLNNCILNHLITGRSGRSSGRRTATSGIKRCTDNSCLIIWQNCREQCCLRTGSH